MKKLLIAFLLGFMLWPSPVSARAKLQGYVVQGNTTLTITGGIGTITRKVQGSFPAATVTIYDAGTTDISTIYSDNSGSAKANPFTSASDGGWFFYANDGRYDVKFSGTGITTPFTLGDFSLFDSTGGTTGTVLMGQTSAPAIWTTATFPTTVTEGDILYGSATNVVGKLPVGTVGKILYTTGTLPAWTTATYPATTTANQLLYSSATNTVAGLASAASGVLVTSAGSVPSIATDIPTAVTIGSAYVYRASGTDIPLLDGGTNASLTAVNGGVAYSSASALALSAAGASGQLLQSAGAATPTWTDAPLGSDTYNGGTTTTYTPVNISTTAIIHSGTVALASASPSAATITGFSPAFTSNTSYVCTATPQGSTAAIAAGGIAVTRVSGSSITLTGPNTVTTVVHYICAGI